jgi:hypothetical protein
MISMRVSYRRRTKLWPAILLMIGLFFGACASSTTRVRPTPKDEAPGFFGKLWDQITERECMVSTFICPYGLGPAGEPCTCTEPSGRVREGITIK